MWQFTAEAEIRFKSADLRWKTAAEVKVAFTTDELAFSNLWDQWLIL